VHFPFIFILLIEQSVKNFNEKIHFKDGRESVTLNRCSGRFVLEWAWLEFLIFKFGKIEIESPGTPGTNFLNGSHTPLLTD
jgi:hypothetical protein